MTFERWVLAGAILLLMLGLLVEPRLLLASGVGFAMAIPVKSVDEAAKKFVQNGSRAGEDYKNGIRGSGGRWQQNTQAAEANYQQGVQDAINRKAFSKGVSESGGGYYEERAVGVGGQRFTQGIAAAGDNWAQGAAPFIQTLAAANIPPRGPKGSQQNQERSNFVAQLLRKKKLGG